MVKLIVFFFGFFMGVCCGRLEAAEFRPLSVQRLSLDIDRFLVNREPMTPSIEMHGYRGRTSIHWDVGFLNETLLWRNEVHGEGTDSKYVTMGWKFEVAIPLGRYLEVHYKHHSRHTLDQLQPTIAERVNPEPFPVEDSYGIRLCFMGDCR